MSLSPCTQPPDMSIHLRAAVSELGSGVSSASVPVRAGDYSGASVKSAIFNGTCDTCRWTCVESGIIQETHVSTTHLPEM